MSNQTDKLKIREMAKDAWIDAGILADAQIGHLGKNTSIHTDLGIPPEFHSSEESLSTRFIRDTHISFLEYATKNFYQSYGQMNRGVWQKRQESAGSLIDPTEFTAEQIYAMWQEKSRK